MKDLQRSKSLNRNSDKLYRGLNEHFRSMVNHRLGLGQTQPWFLIIEETVTRTLTTGAYSARGSLQILLMHPFKEIWNNFWVFL